MASGSERRSSRRFTMSLPLKVKLSDTPSDQTAETRDISFRGLYFLIDGNHEVGSQIEFVLTLPREITMAGDVNIRCVGEVVRIEEHNGRHGIAARIDKYEFLPLIA